MSEVTTLKQLMIDAARYRWVRDNLCMVDSWMWLRPSCGMFDFMADEELAKENP